MILNLGYRTGGTFVKKFSLGKGPSNAAGKYYTIKEMFYIIHTFPGNQERTAFFFHLPVE